MTRTAEDIVRAEVRYCVSSLVHTLAQGFGSVDFQDDIRSNEGRDMMLLAEQAFELARPIDDWEEAAREAGWNNGDQAWSNIPNPENYWGKDGEVEAAGNVKAYIDAQELCESEGIEPHQREVYEHWIVSDWLADRLAEKGEKVDKDFASMTVWARTTTGQGIASDSVIEAIYADLVREYGE